MNEYTCRGDSCASAMARARAMLCGVPAAPRPFGPSWPPSCATYIMSEGMTYLVVHSSTNRTHPKRSGSLPMHVAVPCQQGFLQVCVILSLPDAVGTVSWTGRPRQELGLQGAIGKIRVSETHRRSSAKDSRVCQGARLASELAPQRHDVLLRASQLPLQHMHPHAGICLHVPPLPFSRWRRMLAASPHFINTTCSEDPACATSMR